MSNITITSAFTAIADAIRAKTGKADTMTPAEMPTEIASISGGGSITEITKGVAINSKILTDIYKEV